MRFSIFGIPIHIQLGFWMIAGLIGWRAAPPEQPYLIVVWVVAVLLSILAHELGHAFAMLRYGLQPDITLHMIGGATAAHGLGRLTRPQRIFVSFAGPLAGFLVYGIVYGLVMAAPSVATLPALGPPTPAQLTLNEGIGALLWINLYWGLFNLLPVLPLDGGHILEDLLGPKRMQLMLRISLAVGGTVALWGLSTGEMFITIILGFASWQTYQRLRAMATPTQRRVVAPREQEEQVSPELAARIKVAQAALAEERFDEAGTRAELILSEKPPRKARIEALQIIAWAHLMQDRPEEAERVLKAVGREGTPDPALVGAVLVERGRTEEARAVFEAARAAGDDRKNVVGPLIQLLIEQGEIARAAAIALDIVETLSEEDARQMAQIAFDAECYPWASRLSEAVFERTEEPDDAYDAARGRALEGDMTGALNLLRRAVAAGYSDAARLWSDKALEALRASEEQSELESLLPRP